MSYTLRRLCYPPSPSHLHCISALIITPLIGANGCFTDPSREATGAYRYIKRRGEKCDDVRVEAGGEGVGDDETRERKERGTREKETGEETLRACFLSKRHREK